MGAPLHDMATASTANIHSPDHALHSEAQRRQILFDDQPHGTQVNAQLAMHDHISKPRKFSPRNAGLGILDLDRKPLARFGQGLQIAYHCVLHQA